MANIAKKAILKAKIENEIVELLVKTGAENVYIDENTTLAAKLAEIIASLNEKAKTTELTDAISALRQEMLGDTPVEAYNTFTELAAYIEEHQDAADALTEAIGKKANQTAVDEIVETLNGLGSLAQKSEVEEGDLSEALKEKIDAASEGNHSHENKTVLDSITAESVDGWNSKSTIHYSATEPENLKEGDLWCQIVE